MSLLGMAKELTLEGVRFVVIGGLAARAHGSGRLTEGLDICYAADDDNLRRLAAILVSWNAYLRGVEPGLPFTLDPRTSCVTPVMTLITDRGAIDVMDRVLGVGDYDAVVAGAIELEYEGVVMRALDLPQLIAAKRATRRPKDHEQLPELEALLELRRKRS